VDGLQILGMLETRSLDFDHVVMLSMSDRVFPGRRTMRSFVPVTLRRAFGMPTPDVTEAHTAYHFYRLLSASRHMTLIFDSRSGGLRSGDMSRFLYQLRFLGFRGVDVNYSAATFGSLSASNLQLPADKATGVIKTPAVMKRLERFRDPDCLHSNALSASALNKYLRCPLSFYLEYVADLKIPDDYREDIDEATLGSTFHAVAENVMTYLRDSGKNPITRKKLEEVTESDVMDREILRAINSEVKKIPRSIMADDGKTRIPNPRITSQPLTEEDRVLAVLLREMWRTMTLCEPDPFEFIAAEYSARRQWSPLPDVVDPFNFTMKIDRIDCVDGVLRLVDYKTGSDSTSFNSVEALIDPSKQDRHAIFQLMLYCCAYADFKDDHTTPIKPLIYKTSSFAK
ncbi:MAG: PD-(D/E)XK nuclease family protein, partial [Muribaculaceae bacterium]|nr:PD-(D/E)XK nuclease family protein [Muribaculaceae bacterium]